ncbi:MAG: T9SS type A sorting domain-containing protein [Candidatus Nomurabacteria bacterium]|nr:T9SS type A sorting domain-containing protein [Candidatus Nomurabacteria bacterium]
MKRTFKLFTIITFCVFSHKIYAQPFYSGEIFIDSLTSGKTTIGIYGKYDPVGVKTTITAFANGVACSMDTVYSIGVNPFNIRIVNLSPGSDYYVYLFFSNFYGSDTVDLGRITTLYDNHNNNIFRIKNTLFTRNIGSSNVELRGIIDLSPKSTAVAFCAIYSDSLCKKMIGNMSTRLNYSNNYSFEYMYDLYYSFKIDTLNNSSVYGKFWGSDNIGHSDSDTIPLKLNTINKKGTTSGVDEFEFGKKDISVYPNPVNDFLYFSETEDYKIFNLFGQVVKNNHGNCVNLSDIPTGIYMINIGSKRIQFFKN